MTELITIIRRNKTAATQQELARIGCAGYNRLPVLGRGRQRGVQVGATVYGELSKLCLLLVVQDDEAPKAVEAILKSGKTGHPGDGRIFISEVKEAYTIRTGKADS